ncbi:MAG: hypothetical protein COU33_00090 [Candidatus Magasanikbacteria bacterium CG10_big_fil_rev_8_21_14_0_10_43_6]|uniref:Uncharacterized protein n=1 Tax=Candidatus Magasanikbacteria bacterium CG10_big_fil_rev_8_21_14_0_10_43_6 TaxID=1974650 RepID=A0A2M6W2I3_9BACT|nr:MAG: hypothetical protein COU33_00090 [Candidatus Magasanikbacteria bacterium CG10_big_fil_rev_8_21_14_0_10_43_6]
MWICIFFLLNLDKQKIPKEINIVFISFGILAAFVQYVPVQPARVQDLATSMVGVDCGCRPAPRAA